LHHKTANNAQEVSFF